MALPNPDHLEVEDLLEHQGWVRSLAASLVTAPGRAEDVAQEVWLTGLRRAPGREGSLRGWLARVLRSRLGDLKRSEGRRERRERLAARPESQAPATELAVFKAGTVVSRVVLKGDLRAD